MLHFNYLTGNVCRVIYPLKSLFLIAAMTFYETIRNGANLITLLGMGHLKIYLGWKLNLVPVQIVACTLSCLERF